MLGEFNVERYIAMEKQDSYEDGFEEGRKEGIYSCVTDGKLLPEGAAKLLECSVEDVLADMEQRGFAVPELV